MDKVFCVSKEGKSKFDEKFLSIFNKSEVFENIVSKELIREMVYEKLDFNNNFKGIKIVTSGRVSIEK